MSSVAGQWLLILTLMPSACSGVPLKKLDMERMVASIPGSLYQSTAPTKQDDQKWNDLKKSLQQRRLREDGNEAKDSLWDRSIDVARFLVSHKFYDVDRRFIGHKDIFGEPIHVFPMFMMHFPVPPLKKLWPQDLVDSCEQHISNCINEIALVARYTKTAIARKANRIPLPREAKDYNIKLPFWNRLALFNFRATAVYYMCWYAMRKDPHVSRFGAGRCVAFQYDYEAIQSGKPYPWDIRDKDRYPWGCATYMFCPDFCCGLPPGSTYLRSRCQYLDINPCVRVNQGKCQIPYERNTNMQDLMKNRFNVTCDCDVINPGFQFNTEYSMCLDIDECVEEWHECGENQVCENTIGSYACPCRHGYWYNTQTKKCVYDHMVLDIEKLIVTRGPDPPREESSGFTIIDDIKILIAMFSSSTPPPVTSLLLVPLAVIAHVSVLFC